MFAEKGKRGYLKGKKLKYSCIILALIAVIVFFLVLGYVLNGDKKNIYTIMAVLTVLPMANLLTVLIVCLPYKAPEQSEYEKIAGDKEGKGFLTELAVTSPKLKTIFFPYVYVNNDQIFAYTEKLNGKKEDYQEYIEGNLAAQGLQTDVHIYTEMSAFVRISKQNFGKEELTDREDRIMSAIKSMAI